MAKYEGLTLKQKRFADEYIATGNGTQSVLKAGYNTSYDVAQNIAYENVRKPQVESYIAKQLAAKDINIEFIKEKLLDELRDENPAIRVKVLELLGKHLKMFDANSKNVDLESVKAIAWGEASE